jgi:hypothetical protein
VHVPWAVLELVETRYALTLHVGEARYRSWAAGAPGRPLPVPGKAAAPGGTLRARDHDPTGEAEAVRASRSLRGDSGAAAFMVERRWEQRRALPAAGDEAVTVRWVWHWPVVTVVAIVVAVAAARL